MNVTAIRRLDGVYTLHGPEEYSIAGDAPKHFLRMRDGIAYIAKRPRTTEHGLRECATEFLISRVAAHLPVRMADCALRRLGPLRPVDTVDVRFLSRFFLSGRHERLVHGVEVVARCFGLEVDTVDAEVSKKHERGFYTVELITTVMKQVFPTEHARLAEALGRMVACDAIVGARDRHAMNWGVIENVVTGGPVRFAPLFDTARGLFWNFSDAQLAEHGATTASRKAFVEQYAHRSMPLISADVPSRSAKLSHFDVVEHVAAKMNGEPVRRGVRDVVGAFQADVVSAVLRAEFAHLFSELRLEMIDQLLRYRHARLKKACSLP